MLGNFPPSGGSGLSALLKYGPGDYTGVSDIKEVYWDPTATTPTDGSNGAYIPVGPDGSHNSDKRYQLGELGTALLGIPINP